MVHNVLIKNDQPKQYIVVRKAMALWYSVKSFNRRVAGLRLTRGTALCPCAKHFILCLVLVQHRKTGYHPDMTENSLTGM